MRKSSIKDILLSGGIVEYKKLMICPIYGTIKKLRFQVESRVRDESFSRLYDTIDEALDEFMDCYDKIEAKPF